MQTVIVVTVVVPNRIQWLGYGMTSWCTDQCELHVTVLAPLGAPGVADNPVAVDNVYTDDLDCVVQSGRRCTFGIYPTLV